MSESGNSIVQGLAIWYSSQSWLMNLGFIDFLSYDRKKLHALLLHHAERYTGFFCDKNSVEPYRYCFGDRTHKMLMLPVGFPHTSSDQVALMGFANSLSGNKSGQANAVPSGEQYVTQIQMSLPYNTTFTKQELYTTASAQDTGSRQHKCTSAAICGISHH